MHPRASSLLEGVFCWVSFARIGFTLSSMLSLYIRKMQVSIDFIPISSYSLHMRIIRTIFFYLFLVITFFLGSLFTVLITMFNDSKTKMEKFRRAAKTWATLLVWASGMPLEVSGIENMPNNQAAILASNHQGAADILILLAVLPANFVFIIKKELFDVPIFGWYLRQAGYIPIDRGTRKGAIELFVEAKKRIKSGENILIFPEGTRSPDGNLQPFKRGSLLLAFRSNVPIVPIAISGSYKIMPRGGFAINSTPVSVKIGKILLIDRFNNDSEKANEELHRIIGELLK